MCPSHHQYTVQSMSRLAIMCVLPMYTLVHTIIIRQRSITARMPLNTWQPRLIDWQRTPADQSGSSIIRPKYHHKGINMYMHVHRNICMVGYRDGFHCKLIF
jgi:hypothetical protein